MIENTKLSSRQLFLLKTLASSAKDIHDLIEVHFDNGATTDELANDIVDFMAVIHLLGKEDILPERTPQEIARQMEVRQNGVETLWDLAVKHAAEAANQSTD